MSFSYSYPTSYHHLYSAPSPFYNVQWTDYTSAKEDYAPEIDWKETQTEHILKVSVPGLGKEQVRVEVRDGNILQISGQGQEPEDQDGETWHRREIGGGGKFLKRYVLPKESKVDEIKAKVAKGVLTVTVPKETPKVVEIDDANTFAGFVVVPEDTPAETNTDAATEVPEKKDAGESSTETNGPNGNADMADWNVV